MNLDKMVRRVADDLDARYAGYDVRAARDDLESRVITAELTDQARSVPPADSPTVEPATPRAELGRADDHPAAPASDVTRPSGTEMEHGVPSQEDWRVRAACRDEDADNLFVRGAEQRKAKLLCMGCPVRTECLAEALDQRIEFGVWGGMTERERRALLRRRPDVVSWSELLRRVRRDHQADEMSPDHTVAW